MKQTVNFRLSNEAIIALSLLSDELHTSKTEIVEKALEAYAKKKLSTPHPLLKYAGMLNTQEAASMLDIVASCKHNKDTDIDL